MLISFKHFEDLQLQNLLVNDFDVWIYKGGGVALSLLPFLQMSGNGRVLCYSFESHFPV